MIGWGPTASSAATIRPSMRSLAPGSATSGVSQLPVAAHDDTQLLGVADGLGADHEQLRVADRPDDRKARQVVLVEEQDVGEVDSGELLGHSKPLGQFGEL